MTEEEKLDGFPSDELIDFVINLKRKITLEKGFCTDADVYLAGLKAREKRIAELEKENAELKEQIMKLKHYTKEEVNKHDL